MHPKLIAVAHLYYPIKRTGCLLLRVKVGFGQYIEGLGDFGLRVRALHVLSGPGVDL